MEDGKPVNHEKFELRELPENAACLLETSIFEIDIWIVSPAAALGLMAVKISNRKIFTTFQNQQTQLSRF